MLKGVENIIRGSAVDQKKKKKKAGLKFNPRLALIGLRTTGPSAIPGIVTIDNTYDLCVVYPGLSLSGLRTTRPSIVFISLSCICCISIPVNCKRSPAPPPNLHWNGPGNANMVFFLYCYHWQICTWKPPISLKIEIMFSLCLGLLTTGPGYQS